MPTRRKAHKKVIMDRLEDALMQRMNTPADDRFFLSDADLGVPVRTAAEPEVEPQPPVSAGDS